MKLAPQELRELIIRPTLEYLGCYSKAIENLLVALAQLQEFNSHAPNCQINGLYPIDSDLHQRVWDHYLAFNPDLASRVRGLASQHEFLKHPHNELTTNLSYATAIAWAIFIVYPKVQQASYSRSA